MEPTTTTTSPTNKFTNPVRLSYRDPCLTPAAIEAANKIDVWHKFILFNIERGDKNMVLDTVIENCTPTLLFPVMYKVESENKASFLACCRSNIISKLVNQKLQLKLKNGKIINYDIVLSFLTFKDMQLDPQKIIVNAIRLRLSRQTMTKKSLNLENFTNDKLLGSVYCPIHVPIMFDAILRFSRSIVPQNNHWDVNKLPIRDLILRSNNMESLVFNEKIFNFNFCKLDVSDNKLVDINLLKPFKEYKITELWLDGNRLCSNYGSAKDYINAVKSIFPYLQILDGQVIGTEQKLPIYHKHFISNRIKVSLIKQFIEHFFTCYDQDDRIVMNGLYDDRALFSMTVGPISDNAHKQIIKSFATSRNLLKFVDYAKCTESLLYGPEKIISALRREPATLHKMKYLDIDVTYSSNYCFTVSVQGPFVYRDHKVSPMWFHRTLIVVAKKDHEFCIVNDQYHLDNCPASLNNMDLSELKIVTRKSIPVYNPVIFSTTEKYQLLRKLQNLTTMNAEYSDKFLKEANWDIYQAIKSFMQTYSSNKLSPEAFRH